MVVSSGLVSLNIHEALTFEGTEICLHPDLFSNSLNAGNNNGNPMSSGNTASSDAAGSFHATPSSVAGPNRGANNATLPSTQSNTTSTSLPGATQVNSANTIPNKNVKNNTNSLLQVGDMVEIRVWDPINTRSGGGVTTTSNNSSIIRSRVASGSVTSTGSKINTQPLSGASSTTSSTANNSNVNRKPVGNSNQNQNALEISLETPSNKLRKHRSSDSGGILQSWDHPDTLASINLPETQQSETNMVSSGVTTEQQFSLGTTFNNTSYQTIPELTTTDHVSSPNADLTLSSLDVSASQAVENQNKESSAGPSDLPPMFPRGRTNTVDTPSGISQRTSLLKRPAATQMRSSTNPMIPPSDSNITGSAYKPRANLSAASPTTATTTSTTLGTTTVMGNATKHYRELSDMTADTLFGHTPTAGDTAQSVAEFQVPLVANTHHHAQQQGGIDSGIAVAASDDDDDGWTYISTTHTLRLSFIMLVTEKTLTSLKGPARTQVSILRQVAELYQLSSYDMLTINKVEKDEEATVLEAVSADFVVVTIKDQFISRGDMHYFQKLLIGTWIYEGQRLFDPNRGFQAIARAIRHGDQPARSGIVTDKNTTFTFRSRSARIIWLVQMSAEMWDYASPYERGKDESLCEIYFDKWISFVHDLFAKWKELEATHTLTVVFFSRTFLHSSPLASPVEDMQRDVYGRYYEDHFRTIIESATGPDWDSLALSLKEAFVRYPQEVGWNLASDESSRRPSTASQGNVLEAVNVTLNLLQFHYLDRDLHRTGNSIVLISAGNGVFEVDKGLAGVTYQRMMDNGIGSDMLSLGLPALHIAPFFLYINGYQSVEVEDVDTQAQYYEVPHWMHLSFVSYESEKINLTEPKTFESKEDLDEAKTYGGLEIKAHGFLLPRDIGPICAKQPPASPLLRPTSFTAHGNAAASPSKKPPKLSSERQLIAGRDFRDILEACRPRNTGSIPSPLKAVLEVYASSGGEQNGKEEEKEDSQVSTSFREWGAPDFETLKEDSSLRFRRRTTSVGQDTKEPPPSPRFGITSPPRIDNLLSGKSPPRVDELDRLSSHSSSFASQVSSSILGASYDRPYLAQQLSMSFTGAQLQRPPSLDYDLIEDEECDSDAGENSSDDEVQYHRTKESSKFADKLRKMMQSHDSTIAALPTPKLGPKSENRSINDMNTSRHGNGWAKSGTGVQVSRNSSTQVGSPGGIGAALSQHRASKSSTLLNESDTADVSVSRISSVGRMNSNFSRGLSPLLLPPAHVMATSVDDFLHEGRIPFERRLVHQQDVPSRTTSDFQGRPATRTYSLLAGGKTNETKPDKRSDNIRQSISVSPTDRNLVFGRPKQDAVDRSYTRSGNLDRPNPRPGNLGRPTPRSATRKNRENKQKTKLNKKAFNPFRQQDEEEVLAKKSHNRRRWSHVFPVGEVEFKRHAGPNWKSLTAPAILPLAIDYFPKQEEIDHNFTFSIYNVTLSEFDSKNYQSNKDLLMEMVRQRLTQDYQLVSEDDINASNYRRESLRDGLADRGRGATVADDSPETIRQFLSMGHRLQVLTYDPAADIIEVTRYTAKNAQQNTASNKFKYQYFTYCQETKSYNRVVQTFEKYSDQYNWNKVDRIICGDDDRELREGMRFRRLMFGVLPDRFTNESSEQEYVNKFKRLLDYLNKLCDKEESQAPLNVKFILEADRKAKAESSQVESTPGIARNSMLRFYVKLRKGKRDAMEWMEIVADSTFNTAWSYRIIFNWLVASSGKVETQVQLLQRRCAQYGLNLIPFPQISVAKSLYLNPFKAPAITTVRSKEKAARLDSALSSADFLHDGVFHTDIKPILASVENSGDFVFAQRWGMSETGRQFVHRSGTLFVRILTDKNGLALLVVVGNYRYLQTSNKDDYTLEKAYRHAYAVFVKCIESLETSTEVTQISDSSAPEMKAVQDQNE